MTAERVSPPTMAPGYNDWVAALFDRIEHTSWCQHGCLAGAEVCDEGLALADYERVRQQLWRHSVSPTATQEAAS